MKALPFKIPKTAATSISVQVDRQPVFYDILHQHPETQITLIVAGTGTIFQGEYIGDYQPGDVFVIGANVPHVLRSDVSHYNNVNSISHAISVFFDDTSFGKSFFDLPELSELRLLLHQSKRGMRLTEDTKKSVGQALMDMPNMNGMDNIISLLNVLHKIAATQDLQYLSKDYHPRVIDENEGIRLNEIFQFTISQHHRQIKLEEVAGMANMTISAFCRYFKHRTRKTYITFLNEVRIAQACKLLLNEDLTIAQICYQCGFSNLSHFNRVFKHLNEVSPKVYRHVRTSYQGSGE